ncbi:MAG TPA: DHH family phosphoesterase [Methanosarcinaceae archaeon]|nr:DHH family phosphoesterase [Methanosarcinaceae archaeon]
MKHFKKTSKTDSIILTHGDSDGVCAGAIAKSAYPDGHVYFTSPVNLLKKLEFADGYENIIICDIAVDERTCVQLYERLDALAQVCNVIYIDHHPLPQAGWDSEWLYHDLGPCASELTYRVLEDRLSRDMRRIAIYGAIGDFCDNTHLINEWSHDWDKRGLYFQAGTLIQALTYVGRDYDFKRQLINPLSHDKIPSEIGHLLEYARDASEKEETLRLYIKGHVKIMQNIGYVVNANGYMSKAAIYAASYSQKGVGISAEYRQRKRAYDLSIRSKGFVDINRALRIVTKEHGGTGGGHAFAAGARIPRDSLDAFLRDFDKMIGRYNDNDGTKRDSKK